MGAPVLHGLAHEIAREQVAYWRDVERLKVKDAATILGVRYEADSWREIEHALAMRWRRLPLTWGQRLLSVAA